MHIKEMVVIVVVCIHLPDKIQRGVTENMFIFRMRYLQAALPTKKQIS
jgi:hypothetical protein